MPKFIRLTKVRAKQTEYTYLVLHSSEGYSTINAVSSHSQLNN